jgi:hypothetical protein
MSGAMLILALADIMFMAGDQPKDLLLDLKTLEMLLCLN